MTTWSGTVTITKTWSNVEVVADTEARAEEILGQLNETDLNKASIPDEDVEVDELECIEGCEEEEEEE